MTDLTEIPTTEELLSQPYIKSYADQQYDKMIELEKEKTRIAKEKFETAVPKLQVIREPMIKTAKMGNQRTSYLFSIPGALKDSISVTQLGKKVSVRAPKSLTGFYTALDWVIELEEHQHVLTIDYTAGILNLVLEIVEAPALVEIQHIIQ